MEEKRDEHAVTHQLSAVDDDFNKTGNIKESNVASVALGKLVEALLRQGTDDAQPRPWRLKSPTSCPRT